MSDKIKCLQFGPAFYDDQHHVIIPLASLTPQHWADLFVGAEEWDEFSDLSIVPCEMTQAELDSLPDA
jgi:hypothetical protein